MPSFHKSYEIKHSYLADKILSKVRNDIENAVIDSRGFLPGLLVEIRCSRSVMEKVRETVTNSWISDDSFGAIIQKHQLNVRIYDLASIDDKIEISFQPDSPYFLLVNNRRPAI